MPAAHSPSGLSTNILGVHELAALVFGESLKLDRCRADASSSPARPHVEQFGPGEAEQEQGRAHPVREVLDQLEQSLLRPVDVLEEEDERLNVGELLRQLARGPGDLLGGTVAFERLEHPRREAEQIGDGLILAAGAQLLEGLVQRVVVRDAGRRLDHLRQRPVRDPLPVGQAPAGEHGRSFDSLEELARETALADARLAVDREEVRAPIAHRPLERVLEELELGSPADQRRAQARARSRPVLGGKHAPGAERRVDSLQLERARILDDEAAEGEPVRRRAGEDLVWPRRLLEARGEVDRLPRGEAGLRLVHHEFPGFEADPRLEPELPDLLPDRERGSSGALRVVLVRLRDAEGGQHRVAGELLDDAPVHDDAV